MNKWIRITLFILLVSFFFIRGLKPAWQALQSDFPISYTASRIFYENHNIDSIYRVEWFREKAREFVADERLRFAPFPPAHVFILLPLAGLEPLMAKRVWTILNLLVLLWAIYLLKQVTGWTYLNCTLFFLLTGWALINNFKYGKVYLLLCCFILYAHLLILRGKSLMPALLLSIGILLKYFPLIFVFGYALQRRWRLVLTTVGTLIVLVGVQLALLGTTVFADYLNIALFPHLGGVIEEVSPFAPTFQSWESFFRNIFVYDPQWNPSPLINWPLGKVLFQYSILTIYVVGIFIVLRNTLRLKPEWFNSLSLSLPALLGLAFLPVGATYHFLFLIFPLALYISALEGTMKKFEIALLLLPAFAIGFLPYGIILGFGAEGPGMLITYTRLWLINIVFTVAVLLAFKHLKLASVS